MSSWLEGVLERATQPDRCFNNVCVGVRACACARKLLTPLKKDSAVCGWVLETFCAVNAACVLSAVMRLCARESGYIQSHQPVRWTDTDSCPCTAFRSHKHRFKKKKVFDTHSGHCFLGTQKHRGPGAMLRALVRMQTHLTENHSCSGLWTAWLYTWSQTP